MARAFSPRKLDVYNFILKFKKSHDGNSPSVAEIGKNCEVKSTSQVHDHLASLEVIGLIKLDGDGKSRSIEVVGGKWTPPTLPVVLEDADALELVNKVKGKATIAHVQTAARAEGQTS